MARIKKVPSKVVVYDNLSDVMKRLYDEKYSEFAQKTILQLRELAQEMGVESPTTVPKAELLKRITDWEISKYLPAAEGEVAAEYSVDLSNVPSQRVKGILEEKNGEYYIKDVLVPVPVLKNAKLRLGDMVEGVCTIGASQVLVIVNNVDGESPKANRESFSTLSSSSRREFGQMLAGTEIGNILPDLQTGERVIIRGMSVETANGITLSPVACVGLFMGIAPEDEHKISPDNFVIPFDCSESESARIAKLALSRAKRLAERGKDVIMTVYGYDYIENRDIERALFGAGRSFSRGSLTVIVDVDESKDGGIYAKMATTIV